MAGSKSKVLVNGTETDKILEVLELAVPQPERFEPRFQQLE